MQRTPKFSVGDAARIIQKNPGAYILEVRHDDWCPTLRTGRGDDCRCSPEYRLARADGKAVTR